MSVVLCQMNVWKGNIRKAVIRVYCVRGFHIKSFRGRSKDVLWEFLVRKSFSEIKRSPNQFSHSSQVNVFSSTEAFLAVVVVVDTRDRGHSSRFKSSQTMFLFVFLQLIKLQTNRLGYVTAEMVQWFLLILTCPSLYWCRELNLRSKSISETQQNSNSN